MNTFFDKFANLKGAKMIGLRGYENKAGQVADYVLNVNINVLGAKVKDLQKIKSLTISDLEKISLNSGILVDTVKIAFSEMVESQTKNTLKDFILSFGLGNITAKKLQAIAKSCGLTIETVNKAFLELVESDGKTEKTASSQAQTDAYVHLTKGVKLHKDSLTIKLFGFEHSKVVNPEFPGEYKSVNSSDKTLAKKAIEKFCGFKMSKYRSFDLSNAEQIAISGSLFAVV